MKLAAAAGIAALIGAACNPLAAAPGQAIPICTGDGAARFVMVPPDPGVPAPPDDGKDCFKACHAASSRKRTIANF